MARGKKSESPVKRFEREEFESFLPLSNYERSRLRQGEPSCFNSEVRVERYRWVVERIEEPVEVIYARLLELWETCDNYHHWGPLKEVARRLTGMELPQSRLGVRRKRP